MTDNELKQDGMPGGGHLTSGYEKHPLKEKNDAGENLPEETSNAEGGLSGVRTFKEGDRVYDLVDVVEKETVSISHDGAGVTGLDEHLVREIRAVAEKVARELIPDIAERVIREEIEKLKRERD